MFCRFLSFPPSSSPPVTFRRPGHLHDIQTLQQIHKMKVFSSTHTFNYSWEEVSTLAVPLAGAARALTGVSSTKLGNGSGAPSSSCLFWDGGEYAAVAAGKRQVRYLEVSSREGHGGG